MNTTIGLGFTPRKAKLGNKVMSLKEAVGKFLQDGELLTVCGTSGMAPMALCYEIIRQGKKDLTITIDGGIDPIDMLIGAGCVKRIEAGFVGIGVGAMPGNFRRAVEKGIPHPIQVEDYSNLAMTLRFMAGALGLPFIPTRSLKGSDIAEIHTWRGDKKLALMKSPFSGDEVIVLPPVVPDVAIIHAQQADKEGNVQQWGMIGADDWACFASRKVIVSVERIVDTSIIRSDPNRTLFPGFMVDAVVEVPWGSHPYGVQGFYNVDMDYIFEYSKIIRERDSFLKFLEEWVFGLKDHKVYIKKLGPERIEKLKKKVSALSESVDFGY